MMSPPTPARALSHYVSAPQTAPLTFSSMFSFSSWLGISLAPKLYIAVVIALVISSLIAVILASITGDAAVIISTIFLAPILSLIFLVWTRIFLEISVALLTLPHIYTNDPFKSRKPQFGFSGASNASSAAAMNSSRRRSTHTNAHSAMAAATSSVRGVAEIVSVPSANRDDDVDFAMDMHDIETMESSDENVAVPLPDYNQTDGAESHRHPRTSAAAVPAHHRNHGNHELVADDGNGATNASGSGNQDFAHISRQFRSALDD